MLLPNFSINRIISFRVKIAQKSPYYFFVYADTRIERDTISLSTRYTFYRWTETPCIAAAQERIYVLCRILRIHGRQAYLRTYHFSFYVSSYLTLLMNYWKHTYRSTARVTHNRSLKISPQIRTTLQINSKFNFVRATIHFVRT